MKIKNGKRGCKLFSIYCVHNFNLKCKLMPHFALSEFDAKCVRDFKTRSPNYFPLKCKSMLHFAPYSAGAKRSSQNPILPDEKEGIFKPLSPIRGDGAGGTNYKNPRLR